MSKYINIDYSNGVFYHYSKEQVTEDYKEHTSSTGKKAYRKHFYKGVEGVLQNVSMSENPQGRMQISIFLKDEEDTFNFVNIDAFTQKGTLSEYAESFIRHVNALKKGKYYRVTAYKLDADYLKKSDKDAGKDIKDKYYDISGISIKEIEPESGEVIEKVEPTLHYTGTGENIIPRLDFKVDPISLKNRPTAVSVEQKESFLKAELMKAINGHLAREDSNINSKPDDTPPKTLTPKDSVNTTDDDEYDDLPF